MHTVCTTVLWLDPLAHSVELGRIHRRLGRIEDARRLLSRKARLPEMEKATAKWGKLPGKNS